MGPLDSGGGVCPMDRYFVYGIELVCIGSCTTRDAQHLWSSGSSFHGCLLAVDKDYHFLGFYSLGNMEAKGFTLRRGSEVKQGTGSMVGLSLSESGT